MAGVNELRITGNLNPAIVKNNRNPEGNAVSGTINAGTDVNNTPRAAIVTLNWNSLRQISPDDGSSVPLGVNFGAFRGDNPVLIQIRLISNTGNLISNSRFPVKGYSVGPFSRDYRIDIPVQYFNSLDARNVHYPMTVQVVREDLEFRANNAIGKNPFNDDGENILEEGQKRFTEFSRRCCHTDKYVATSITTKSRIYESSRKNVYRISTKRHFFRRSCGQNFRRRS